MSAGAVLGAGIISLPAMAAAVAGPASIVAWLALVVVSAPLAWLFAELGARFPDAGGVSSYVRQAFGHSAADAVGWVFYLSVPVGAPVAASFAGGYLADALGGGRVTSLATFAVIITVVFILNWLGLHVSGRVQLVMVSVLVSLLAVTVLVALPHAQASNFTPFAPQGWPAVGVAAAMLVWAFAGWEAVASLSPDYANPRRDVPKATLLAVVVVGVLYLGVAVTNVAVLGPSLGQSQAPLADLLAVGIGEPARLITAIVALLLTLGTVNAYVAGATRLGTSLAAEGALPRWLAGTDHRSLTFIVASAIVVALLPLDQHTFMLMVSGGITLVYVIGTAAALKLLPGVAAKAVAAFSLVSVCVLLWLTGWPALLGLAVAAAALGYRLLRLRRGSLPAGEDALAAEQANAKP